MTEYDFHPAADIFPLMDSQTFEELKADIDANGMKTDIVLFEGKIIDGRNRYRAMLELGIDPVCNACELVDCNDPVAYVLSLNLHRRHLTTSQRAMIAAKVRDIYDEQAKERQKLSNGRGKKGVEKLPHLNKKARDQAGAALKVSGKLVDAARTVLTEGSEVLIGEVVSGKLAVTRAAALAKGAALAKVVNVSPDKSAESPADVNSRLLAELEEHIKAAKAKVKKLVPNKGQSVHRVHLIELRRGLRIAHRQVKLWLTRRKDQR